jgi:uncharacterized membrane protein
MSTPHRTRRVEGTRTRNWMARVSESVTSRLWPLPLAAVVMSAIVGILIPLIDQAIDSTLPSSIDVLVFNGGSQTARSVLSSIAGSLITATSLTFSLTVLALQLASSQASPRVLRLFASDRQVHATLAVFLGTFAYSITVLRSVRDATAGVSGFVPRIAVTLGFVVTLVSVIMLVFFLAHLAALLRIETILKNIHSETDRAIDLLGDSNASADAFDSGITVPELRSTVTASSSGFITSRSLSALVAIAAEHGIVIQETKRVGDNIVTGTPLAHWWPGGDDSSSGGDAVDEDGVQRAVRRAYVIGYERTAAQDVDYGAQQIVDIGVRALSPGINDPTTASHALGHLSSLLARIVEIPALPAGIAGPDGRLRVVTASRPVDEIVDDALSQLRHYGAGDSVVVTRLLQLVRDLAYTCPSPEVRSALVAQLDALAQQLQNDHVDPASSTALLDACSALRRELASAGSPG